MDVFVALYILILAAFTGYETMSKVPVPLYSTAISAATLLNGIILIGAIIIMGQAETTAQIVMAFIAIAFAAANAVGGYILTKKNLNVFSRNNMQGDE